MGFPRQEYWSGLLFPSPGDLPDVWTNLGLLHWQTETGSYSPYIYIFFKGEVLRLSAVRIEAMQNEVWTKRRVAENQQREHEQLLDGCEFWTNSWHHNWWLSASILQRENFYLNHQGMRVIKFQVSFVYLSVNTLTIQFFQLMVLSFFHHFILSFFIQHLLSSHFVWNYCLMFCRGVKTVEHSP